MLPRESEVKHECLLRNCLLKRLACIKESQMFTSGQLEKCLVGILKTASPSEAQRPSGLICFLGTLSVFLRTPPRPVSECVSLPSVSEYPSITMVQEGQLMTAADPVCPVMQILQACRLSTLWDHGSTHQSFQRRPGDSLPLQRSPLR